ncbi:MAG TPA: hypothetical protein VHX86_10175 [Tepidisphaeraceae bacterium]|jgi:AmiR/NasT family two-component response regulator|nr:hypothetical protein [Tepidisphaeraceae bacterium]
MPEAVVPAIIVLVRDLVFSSKIAAEARAAGVAAQVVRNPEELHRFSQTAAKLLIVDVTLPGSIPASAHWGHAEPGRCVVAFVSHVDQSTIAEAKQAGIDKVLARGRFVKMLPQLVRGEAVPESSGTDG